MSAEVFLDANILIYAVSVDPREAEKAARAVALIETTDFGISAQVLQEFYVTAVRKMTPPLDPVHAFEWIQEFAKAPCQPVDIGVVQRGVQLSQRYRIHYWDGAILAAAESLGASTLYTEDLSHGQEYGAVRVLNPFLA